MAAAASVYVGTCVSGCRWLFCSGCSCCSARVQCVSVWRASADALGPRVSRWDCPGLWLPTAA
eukprot:1116304-Rhodomonas_salina.1